MASTFMSNSEKRAARMKQVVNENSLISTTAYNLILGLVVLYGLVVNFILCITIDPMFFWNTNPYLLIIGYIVFAIIGGLMAAKSNNAIISFIGYNFVVVPMGVLVSFLVFCYGGVDSPVVAGAFFYTSLITAIMVLAAILFPQFFAKVGGFLAVALIGLLISGIIMSIFNFYSNTYSYIAAAIFALYIGYDFYRSQQFPKTADNAVDSALDIYMDIINLFVRLLSILGRRD